MQDQELLAAFGVFLKTKGRSTKTIVTYEGAVRRALRQMNISDVSKVTPIDLAEWRRKRIPVATPATVNLEIDALRQFFRFAREGGFIAVDPTERLRRVSEESGIAPRWLNRQEQHRLIRAVQLAKQAANTEKRKLLADRDGALIALMLHAGLRVSEVCSLDVTDITISERKGSVLVRQGKGGKRREVPLNKDARRMISHWLEHRNEGGVLFPGSDGSRLTTRAAQIAVERLARKAGLKVTPHQLRHTFCHELVQRGVSLDKVALLAGHTTAAGLPQLQTTVRYTLPDRGDLEAAVEVIEWE